MDLKICKLKTPAEYEILQYMNNFEEYKVEECKVVIDRYILERGRDGIVIIGNLFLDGNESIPYIQNYKSNGANNV